MREREREMREVALLNSWKAVIANINKRERGGQGEKERRREGGGSRTCENTGKRL